MRSCNNGGVETRRWINSHQPQTLQIAVFLFYINAAFAVLFALIGRGVGPLTLVTVVGGLAAGNGIANENKWGYNIGLVVAFLPLVYRFAVTGSPLSSDVISLMFEIALIALLLHPQSREYQKIWFK